MTDIVGATLGAMGLVSVIYALVILAQFGRKLGAVTKMRSFYRGYYAAIACVVVALVMRFIRASVFWAPRETIPSLLNAPLFYLLLYHLPLAIGLTLGLGITWHYWSWLLKER
jgi:chromate transport protein ChrA